MIPGAGANVEEHGARRIADVGHVHAALRQLPEQPTVDCTECKPSFIRESPSMGHVIQNPRNLAAGKVRVDQQARTFLNERFVALGF